jgi:hypothetical protein
MSHPSPETREAKRARINLPLDEHLSPVGNLPLLPLLLLPLLEKGERMLLEAMIIIDSVLTILQERKRKERNRTRSLDIRMWLGRKDGWISI